MTPCIIITPEKGKRKKDAGENKKKGNKKVIVGKGKGKKDGTALKKFLKEKVTKKKPAKKGKSKK